MCRNWPKYVILTNEQDPQYLGKLRSHFSITLLSISHWLYHASFTGTSIKSFVIGKNVTSEAQIFENITYIELQVNLLNIIIGIVLSELLRKVFSLFKIAVDFISANDQISVFGKKSSIFLYETG